MLFAVGMAIAEGDWANACPFFLNRGRLPLAIVLRAGNTRSTAYRTRTVVLRSHAKVRLGDIAREVYPCVERDWYNR